MLAEQAASRSLHGVRHGLAREAANPSLPQPDDRGLSDRATRAGLLGHQLRAQGRELEPTFCAGRWTTPGMVQGGPEGCLLARVEQRHGRA